MTTSLAPASLARMTAPPMVGSWRARSTPSTMITSLRASSPMELVVAGTPSMSSRTLMRVVAVDPGAVVHVVGADDRPGQLLQQVALLVRAARRVEEGQRVRAVPGADLLHAARR